MRKRGVLGSADDDIAFFLHILSLFIDPFFAEHEHVFLATTCKFCMFIFTIRCCICLHIMTLFIVIYMHSLHICSTWKTRDGPKCVKNFGVLGVSGLNK